MLELRAVGGIGRESTRGASSPPPQAIRRFAPPHLLMDGFVAVIKASELSPGHMTLVVVDRERVLLANVDGMFYALQDSCGHRQAPLSKGTLEGTIIECPLHFAQFDVRTGKLVSGPAAADVPVYEVRVEGDTVYVRR